MSCSDLAFATLIFFLLIIIGIAAFVTIKDDKYDVT